MVDLADEVMNGPQERSGWMRTLDPIDGYALTGRKGAEAMKQP